MRFATFLFTVLAWLVLLWRSLEVGEAMSAPHREEPWFSAVDAAGVSLVLWALSALLIFRLPRYAAGFYAAAGVLMIGTGLLDFGAWHGIFVFGLLSLIFAAMAWCSWLVQILWAGDDSVESTGRSNRRYAANR